jgi:hypothetical protein
MNYTIFHDYPKAVSKLFRMYCSDSRQQSQLHFQENVCIYIYIRFIIALTPNRRSCTYERIRESGRNGYDVAYQYTQVLIDWLILFI